MQIIFSSLTALILLLTQSKTFIKYLWKNPNSFGLNSCLGLYHTFYDFGLTSLLVFGFYSLGHRLTRLLEKPSNLSLCEESVLSILIGESLIALVLFIAGIFGFFKPLFFISLFLFLSLITLKNVPSFILSLKKLKKLALQEYSWFSLICLTILFMVLIRSIVATSAPPSDWDSLAYHLALPKIYLAESRITPIHWAINAHYPLNTEMLYLFGMALGGAQIPQWINLFHGLFFINLTAQFARSFFNLNQEGIFGSVALLGSQPVFQRVIGNASTDIPLALGFLMALRLLWLSLEDREIKNRAMLPFLSGLCMGAALGAKITGLWYFCGLLWIALFFKLEFKLILYFILGALIFGSAWYLNNWVTMGNPLWPYLGEWFNANAMDLDSWHRIRDSVTEGVEKNWLNFIILPYHLLFYPDRFLYGSHYLLWPFTLLFILRIFQRKAFERTEIVSLWLVGTSFALWFWTYQNWRYLLPLISLLALLIAYWSFSLYKAGRKLKWFSLVSLMSLMPIASLPINNELFVFFNLKSKSSENSPRERYLEMTLGPPYILSQVANDISPNSKILLYKDVRGYYLNHAYAWGDPLNPGTFSYRYLRNSEELFLKLKELKFTHILHNPYIGNYKGDSNYYKHADRLMEGLIKDYTISLYQIARFGLYELRKDHPVQSALWEGNGRSNSNSVVGKAAVRFR